MTSRWILGSVLMVLVAATIAAAQTPRPVPMFRHGSTVSLFAGAGAARSRTAGIGGAAVGWELTPHITFEGSGAWMEWGSGLHGFAAAITAQAGLTRVRSVVPFVTGGVGLYRASFDRDGGGLPDFYQRRMADASAAGTTAVFTDPTVVFGGGVNAFVNDHWAIQPDVREMAVLRNSRSYFVTTVAVHVAYHFEDHPVRPKARNHQ